MLSQICPRSLLCQVLNMTVSAVQPERGADEHREKFSGGFFGVPLACSGTCPVRPWRVRDTVRGLLQLHEWDLFLWIGCDFLRGVPDRNLCTRKRRDGLRALPCRILPVCLWSVAVPGLPPGFGAGRNRGYCLCFVPGWFCARTACGGGVRWVQPRYLLVVGCGDSMRIVCGWYIPALLQRHDVRRLCCWVIAGRGGGLQLL